MSTLVMFTSGYPFGTGEEFVDPELAWLRERFDRVILVPELQRGLARRMPEGVECDASLAVQNRGFVRRCARYLLRLPSTTVLQEAFRSGGPRCIGDAIRLVIFFDRARLVQQWVTRQLRSHLLDVRHTVFYCYWLLGAAYGIGRLKRRIPSLKLVARAHRGDLYWEEYYPFQRQMLRRLDRVFPISEFARQSIGERCPEALPVVEVARLGSRRPAGISGPSCDGIVRCLSCSNMIDLKRLDLLIESLALLSRMQPIQRLHWTHLGDGPAAARLRTLAKEKLTESSVSWEFRGAVPHDDVFEFYAKTPVDLFLSTSLSEGVPVTMMEAQSHGVPVVATDVGAVHELVTPETGMLLPASPSASQVAQALADAVSDRDRLTRWRLAARRNWEARYNADTNYPAFAAKLVAMLPAEQPPRASAKKQATGMRTPIE